MGTSPRITNQVRLDAAAISPPGPDNYRCQQCQLYQKSHQPFSDWPPEGQRGATAILTSSPLDTGDQLWYDIRHTLFEGTGLTDDNVVFVKPTLCVPYTRKITAKQLRLCQSFIDNSLSELQPVRVLAMGANAVKQVAGEKATIKALLGASLVWRETPLFITYDPTMALAGLPATLLSIRGHILRMMHGLTKALPDFPGWKKGI